MFAFKWMKQINTGSCGGGSASQTKWFLFYCLLPGECWGKSPTRLHFGLSSLDLYPFGLLCREPRRALESGQCHQPDFVVQTVYARLQRGGIMQHHQRLAGHSHAPVRDAGVHAAARGVLGWVSRVRRLPVSLPPPEPAVPLPCTLVFGQGPLEKPKSIAYKKGQSWAQKGAMLKGAQEVNC